MSGHNRESGIDGVSIGNEQMFLASVLGRKSGGVITSSHGRSDPESQK